MHARIFLRVHAKRRFPDMACTLAQSVPLRIYISQVIGYWETDTLWLKTDGHAKRKKQKTNRYKSEGASCVIQDASVLYNYIKSATDRRIVTFMIG